MKKVSVFAALLLIAALIAAALNGCSDPVPDGAGSGDPGSEGTAGIAPAEQSGDPVSAGTGAAEGTSASGESGTAAGEIITSSHEGETGVPDPNGTAAPEETTALPPEDTTVPEDTTGLPPEDTTVPEDTTGLPPEDTTAPEETTALPPEDTTAPEDTTELPPEDTTAPEETTAAPCRHEGDVRIEGAVEAGCLSAGYSGDIYCAECGEMIEKGEVSAALGHSFGSWKGSPAPTCTAAGKEVRTCARCGASESRNVAATGHKAVSDKAVAATCTAAGRTAGSHCSVCGTVLSGRETVPALGHNYTEKVVAPTYTAEGYTLHTCTRCKYSYKDNYVDRLVDPKAMKGKGTKADPYQVATDVQLAALSDYLSKTGLYFRQVADIDLGSLSPWTPIGTEDRPFRNNFDGGGYKITGLSIAGTGDDTVCLGLFGSVRGVTLSNVVITGASLTNGQRGCGLLVGEARLSTVSGCSASGTVAGNAEYGCHTAGGLVGAAYGTAITNCFANVTVTNGNQYVGGLAGIVQAFDNGNDSYTLPSVSGCASAGSVSGSTYVGGLIGYDADADVTRCSSRATVSAKGLAAGGLLGALDDISNSVSSPSVSFCFATGDVETTGTGYGAAFAGGLIGRGTFDNVIHDCYSTGNVTCGGSWSDCQDNWTKEIWLRYRNPAGSFIGCMEATYHEKADGSRYALTVYNCYSTGSVTFKKEPWVSDTGIANGSLIGCVYDFQTYYNCKSGSAEGKQDVFFGRTENNYCVSSSREYYLAIPRYGRTLPDGEFTSHTVVTNITAAQLKTQSVFAGFDFSKDWKMGSSGPELRNCAAVKGQG
jgi:hypothetical protein